MIGLVLSQILKGRVSIRFILFCMVGLSGIFVQLLITGLTMLLINQFPTSQTLGIIAAMTSNYFLNNIITFQERQLKSLDLIRGLFSFYLICALGAFANIAIATYIFGFSSNWLISSFIGACFGAVWNFTLTSIFTWKSKWKNEKQSIQSNPLACIFVYYFLPYETHSNKTSPLDQRWGLYVNNQ